MMTGHGQSVRITGSKGWPPIHSFGHLARTGQLAKRVRLRSLTFVRFFHAGIITLGVTQLVDECRDSRPIAPEYGQDGTCAARPIASISYTKTVQLRNS